MKLRLEIPPETAQLRRVRRVIDGWAAAHGLPSESLNLVATELLANAMAVCPPGELIELGLELTGEEVALAVSDCGATGFEPQPDAAVGTAAPRGRGLLLVRHLTNRLSVERIGDRTVVTAYQYRQMLTSWAEAEGASPQTSTGNGRRAGSH